MGRPELISSSMIAKASKFEQVLLTGVSSGRRVSIPDFWISCDVNFKVEFRSNPPRSNSFTKEGYRKSTVNDILLFALANMMFFLLHLDSSHGVWLS